MKRILNIAGFESNALPCCVVGIGSEGAYHYNNLKQWHGLLWKATDMNLRQSLLANSKYGWSIPICQMERKIASKCRGVKISHIGPRKWLFATSLYHIQ